MLGWASWSGLMLEHQSYRKIALRHTLKISHDSASYILPYQKNSSWVGVAKSCSCESKPHRLMPWRFSHAMCLSVTNGFAIIRRSGLLHGVQLLREPQDYALSTPLLFVCNFGIFHAGWRRYCSGRDWRHACADTGSGTLVLG